MRREDMLRQIGSVDDRFIEELFTDSIKATKPVRRKPRWALIAACFAVIILSGAMLHSRLTPEESAVDKPTINDTAPIPAKNSVIMLDVNPSIKLEVNDKGQVVEVKAENADAQAIIDGLELNGKDYRDALSEAVSAMQEQNYITSLRNSVLITVLDDSEEKADSLRSGIVEAIELNDEGEYGISILSQTMTEDEQLDKTAEQYCVSPGRMWLVEKVCSMNETFTEDEFAEENIHIINQILEYIGLPESVHRDGAVAGVVPEEYRGDLHFEELNGEEVISFAESLADFYDKWGGDNGVADADSKVEYAFKSATSDTDEAREICSLVSDSLCVLAQGTADPGNAESVAKAEKTQESVRNVEKLAQGIISIVEYFD